MIYHTDIGRLKSTTGLFIQQPIQANNKESPNPHIAYSLWGIHQWSVDSPHKKPMMWKVLSCHMMTSSKKTFPPYWPIASQITSLTTVYSTVYSDADQRKHQSSASLDFVRGIHRGPVNSMHKWPVTRKMFLFDDVIMVLQLLWYYITLWAKWEDHIHFGGISFRVVCSFLLQAFRITESDETIDIRVDFCWLTAKTF